MRARCGMFDAILYKVLPNHRIPKSLTINRTKPSVAPHPIPFKRSFMALLCLAEYATLPQERSD